MADASGATVLATGMLPALLIVSAALTAVVSAWLLHRYRRAVARSMARSAGAAAPPGTPRRAAAGGAPLHIVRLDPAAAREAPTAPPARAGARAARQAAGVYAAGGAAYAVVLATPWMVFAGGELVATRLLWLAACYAWPAVLAIGVVTATDARGRAMVGAGYAVLLALAALVALARSDELDVAQLAFFWLYANAPGTVLLAGFMHRRIRAVGPLVFAFMTAGVAGAFLAIELAGRSDAVLRVIVAIGAAAGLGAGGIFLLLHLAGFAVFAFAGWKLLGWLGRRYRAKRFSDESLTLDAIFLFFAVAQSFTFAFESVAWMAMGPAGFAAYTLVTRAGFGWLALDAERPGGTLFVLRVFALGARSERLFGALGRRWLRTGPITLIAGPDLAAATVEPHEFLDFVGGRLSRQFVQGERDLAARLAGLDLARDPDGRCRVNAFFCHADTWRSTMQRLAARSDAVLMDLRSFSERNQGCIFELGQLLDAVDLTRVVFVVDASTDVAFLERTLDGLWRTTPAGSPNRRTAAPTARLFTAAGPSRSELRALLGLLAGAAAAPAPEARDAERHRSRRPGRA